jgi:hypothetical protein
MEAATKGSAGKPARWRRIVPWVLTIIALVAAMNVRAKRQVLDTDNWVSTSSELLENDQIRQAFCLPRRPALLECERHHGA